MAIKLKEYHSSRTKYFDPSQEIKPPLYLQCTVSPAKAEHRKPYMTSSFFHLMLFYCQCLTSQLSAAEQDRKLCLCVNCENVKYNIPIGGGASLCKWNSHGLDRSATLLGVVQEKGQISDENPVKHQINCSVCHSAYIFHICKSIPVLRYTSPILINLTQTIYYSERLWSSISLTFCFAQALHLFQLLWGLWTGLSTVRRRQTSMSKWLPAL